MPDTAPPRGLAPPLVMAAGHLAPWDSLPARDRRDPKRRAAAAVPSPLPPPAPLARPRRVPAENPSAPRAAPRPRLPSIAGGITFDVSTRAAPAALRASRRRNSSRYNAR